MDPAHRRVRRDGWQPATEDMRVAPDRSRSRATRGRGATRSGQGRRPGVAEVHALPQPAQPTALASRGDRQGDAALGGDAVRLGLEGQVAVVLASDLLCHLNLELSHDRVLWLWPWSRSAVDHYVAR